MLYNKLDYIYQRNLLHLMRHLNVKISFNNLKIFYLALSKSNNRLLFADFS